MGQRKGGIIQVSVDGVLYDAKGDFTCNFGVEKTESIVGADRVHGYKEVPQVPYIEGLITDSKDLDTKAFLSIRNALVSVLLANGKTFTLSGARYAGDGNMTTGEGEIEFRFEGDFAEEG